MPHPLPLLRVVLACLICACVQARADIEAAVLATAKPAQGERIDISVVINASFTSPFSSAEVALDAELTWPSGATFTTPGFYREGVSGKSSVWAFRLVSSEPGAHRVVVILREKGRATARRELDFMVEPRTFRGFLRTKDAWSFQFDNGETFRGIGYNLCWESRSHDDSRHFQALHENRRFNYDTQLANLAAHGGNYLRVWMCGWNFPLEWPHPWDTDRYQPSARRYNESAAERMDAFVERLRATNLYAMVALDAHVNLLGGAWDRSPYNVRNGGPAATAQDFFASPEARAQYKDRLRYVVARWGYSPHIGAWEFFNEIDNVIYGVKPALSEALITEWHGEMAGYLRSLDPRHLITTSVSHRDVDGKSDEPGAAPGAEPKGPAMNDLPAIDFNQKHIYGRIDGLPEVVARYAAAHGKPYVIGEYGFEWDWTKDFNGFADEMDREFKKGLWLGLYSPTPVLPLSWWWEFFDERGLLPYVGVVRRVSDRMMADGGGRFEAARATWSGQAVRVHAVRTGSVLHAVLSSPGKFEERGSIQFVDTTGVGSLEVTDPESGSTWEVPAVDGRAELRVPGGRELLVRLPAPL